MGLMNCSNQALFKVRICNAVSSNINLACMFIVLFTEIQAEGRR